MKNHRLTDEPDLTIIRRMPDWAFVSIVLGLLAQAMIFYAGFSKWADATQQNTIELKSLTTAIAAMQVSNAARDVKIAEFERRINHLEEQPRK